MTKILIIGGKGTAVNVAEQIADASARYNLPFHVLGFAIDDESLGKTVNNFPVICKTYEIPKILKDSEVRVIFALYKSRVMKERVELLKSFGILLNRFAIFVHPSAYVSSSAKLGPGTVVLSHSTIQANVQIGCFNIVNSNTVIEHDTKLGNNNVIAAAAYIGSECRIGNGVFIGSNSTIREHILLEDFSFVGMSSTVTKDVGVGQLVVGNPARVVEKSW